MENPMKEETVTRIVNNFYVLQGYIREAHIKLLALEETLKESEPLLYERYRQVAREFESDSKSQFRLEDIEGLRKALLQDRL